MVSQATSFVDRLRRRVPSGPGTLLGAAAMLLGLLLLISGISRWWLVEVHATAKAAPILPEHFWAALTLLGFGWPLLIVGLSVGWARPHRCAILLRAAVACAVFSPLLKFLFRFGRPGRELGADALVWIGDPVIYSGSMPSGHAMAAFAVGWAMAAPCQRHGLEPGRDAGFPVTLGAVLLVAAGVAWSRVAVGAHWPADVFVGAGLGIWIAAWASALETSSPWRHWLASRAGKWFQVGLMVVCCLAWAATETGLAQVRILQWGLAASGLALAAARAWSLVRASGAADTGINAQDQEATAGSGRRLRADRLFQAASRLLERVKDRPRLWAGLACASSALILLSLLALQPVDLPSLMAAVSAVPVQAWALAVCGWLGAYALRASRLQAEWRHRATVPWRTCLTVVLQHNAAVLLVPARLGETGYLLAACRVWGVTMAEAAASLARWRLQDACVLGSVALVLWAGVPAWALALVWWVAAGAFSWLGRRQRGGSVVRWLGGGGWATAWLQWLLRLAVVAMMLHLMLGDGSRASWVMASSAALGGELGALWPLQGPAGLGPFEAGAVAGARLQATDLPPGLVASALAVHAVCVLIALGAAAAACLPAGVRWLLHALYRERSPASAEPPGKPGRGT